ncbi:hypothetical protein [Mycolicibacterium mengxianglii]|uniref:hypothetical protein n=1 Tax=Mycolicibacterium mengxianglii TaxID=2736649 RepID=UPI0018D0006C|nr:hypothetical protein [Mycolicibacterium mengxianglii]
MTGFQAGAQPTADDPHTLVFSIAAVLCLLLPVITVGSKRDLGWQRKVYWGSTFGSAACVFVASLPNIATGLIFVVFVLFITTVRAYFASQYIKIGGHVIAFHSAPDPARHDDVAALEDDQPYSPSVSAAKMWWLMVIAVGVIGSGNMWAYVVDREDLRYGILGLGIVVAAAVLYGIGDAMHLQRIARGQYLQFAVLALVSAGIFPVLYVIAHWVTLRVKKSS